MPRIVPFIYYGNLHIPWIAGLLLAATATWLDLSLTPALYALAMAGAFVVYQVDHGWRIASADVVNQPSRVAWVRRHTRYVTGSIGLAFAVAALAVGHRPSLIAPSSAVLVVVGLAYGGSRGLRHNLPVAGLKPVLITGVWTFGVTLWPLSLSAASETVDMTTVVLLVGARMCWIGANVGLAEGVDLAGDIHEGVRTLPARLDTQRRVSLLSAALLSVSALLLLSLGMQTGRWALVGWELAGVAVAFGMGVHGYRKKRLATPQQRWLRDVLVAWPGLGTWWL